MTSILPAACSKIQEIEHYAAFVNALPQNCYLHDILDGTTHQVATLIRDDMVIPVNLTQLNEYKRQAEQELNTLRAEVRAIQDQKRTLERERERLQDGIADLRNAARKMASV